jgi:hypothetical protein
MTIRCLRAAVFASKKHRYVGHININIIFAVQMRTLLANNNWWQFTTEVVDS